MRKVWSVADCIVSPLGSSSLENFERLRSGCTGVGLVEDPILSNSSFCGSKMPDEFFQHSTLTRFDTLCLAAIKNTAAITALPPERTLFLLSTTKGNIELLAHGENDQRMRLNASAAFLAKECGLHHYQVISQACISGVLALIVGKRYLEAGYYDHAVVVGADVLSKFVISGFQGLQALSPEPCKPFDVHRKGINLGEAAAVMILSARPEAIQREGGIRLLGAGLTNDANHISGPSRTGDELAFAIKLALDEAGADAAQVDFLSAHGTATLYNDEMEAKAFSKAGLEQTPLNSVKGYYGHTLGAAGVLETVLAIQSAEHSEMIPTRGFGTPGVSANINVIDRWRKARLTTILKTASGFGGCNAALIIQKDKNT